MDYRLSIFSKLPIKYKNIICQPLIEHVNIEQYLNGIELVVVGGESDYHARPLDYDWVLSIRRQCIDKNVHFEFRQCGIYFIKNGKRYTLNVRQLCNQAKKANINCYLHSKFKLLCKWVRHDIKYLYEDCKGHHALYWWVWEAKPPKKTRNVV